MALNKPLETITETDLQSLVDNQVPEGKTIEYKESLPGNADSDKKEFLADVSSFANAAGGNLIYGIREDGGLPVEVAGLQGIDVDAEKLRLDNMVRDGLKPRIPGVSIKDVPLQSGAVVLIIRVPRSWAAPHMIIFKSNGKFYARHSAGKAQLDVDELRSAFVLSETRAERIRSFRADRLAKIVAGETPVELQRNARTVLHIVPVGAFDAVVRFDVTSLERQGDLVEPMCARGYTSRHNFDGFLTYAAVPGALAHSYLQVFSHGSVEALEDFLLEGDRRVIFGARLEQELIASLPRFLSIQRQLGVEPPLFIMLSLIGVAGYSMDTTRLRPARLYNAPIDRDTLVVPEVMIDTFEIDPAQVLKPAFDAVWNAAGWPGSMSYNAEGQWVGY